MADLFAATEAGIGVPEVVVYNASGRVRGPIVDLDPEEVRRAIEVSAYGGFLVVQQAARRLLPWARARSSSPAPPPASRASPTPRASRSASSACAVSPRARRASWRPRASMSRIS
ncbi:hypothetical protein ACFSUK_05295 [Sphingobium scionense]